MTSRRLRIAYAGTPEIARRILESILEKNQHDVQLVYTQPDRPAGRGRKLKLSQVKSCALEHGIPVRQPPTSSELNTDELSELDLMLVVAYGLLLKKDVLSAPRLGCINIHTSLLPRWRGAAPIQRAIEAGDSKSGITIMQMDEGLDTGPLLLQEECPIYPDDTAGKLHDRLIELGIAAIHPLLNQLAQNQTSKTKQDDSQACYAGKISKAEAELNWDQPASLLERKIRAFNPFPIAHGTVNDLQIRIWQASVKPHKQGTPGTLAHVDKNSIDIITGNGVLAIEQLQLPGKRPVSVKDFVNGHPEFATELS